MIITSYKFVYADDEDAKEDESQSCYQFLIDFDKEEVETNCGDFYYDYSISFDNIIKLADYIKSRRNNGKETRKA